VDRKRVIAALLALGTALGGAVPVGAAEAPGESDVRASERTPPRLSFISGEVSFWRPGAEDWAPARVNTPLAPGDALYTGPGANLELEIGPRAFVRAGAGTQVGMESLEPDFLQIKVTAGHASLDLRELPAGHTVELNTPNAAFTVERTGYYRVDVGQETTTFSARRGGRAMLASPGGPPAMIAAGQQVAVTGADSPRVETSAAPELSDWDRWNYARTGELLEATSARYVPPGVSGVRDLDRHGSWRVVADYGPVWVPHAVPPGWAPYSTGRWIWDPHYGWTWVDDAPWGWAPYHYGRWVFVDRFWAWAPGPIVVRPVYAPALVAFFGVSVSVGHPLGWVALSWGEPLIPWWGRAGFIGRPWWAGWGGPRIVNNVVIHRTTVVNVTNINVYRNASVHRAVVAVPADRFGRDHVAPARVALADVDRLAPLRGPLSVKPVRASLVPATGPAVRPPEAVQKRSVVATRAPRGARAPLGIEEAGGSPAVGGSPPPRLVPAPSRAAAPASPAHPQAGRLEAPDRPRPAQPPRVESPRRGETREGEERAAPAETAKPPRAPQSTRPEGAVRPEPPRSEGRPARVEGGRPSGPPAPPRRDDAERTEAPPDKGRRGPAEAGPEPGSIRQRPQPPAPPQPPRPEGAVRPEPPRSEGRPARVEGGRPSGPPAPPRRDDAERTEAPPDKGRRGPAEAGPEPGSIRQRPEPPAPPSAPTPRAMPPERPSREIRAEPVNDQPATGQAEMRSGKRELRVPRGPVGARDSGPPRQRGRE
jgi:hypothetical protein